MRRDRPGDWRDGSVDGYAGLRGSVGRRGDDRGGAGCHPLEVGLEQRQQRLDGCVELRVGRRVAVDQGGAGVGVGEGVRP